MSRWAALALTLLVAGCRLDAVGLSTEESFLDGDISGEAGGESGGDDATPVFPVEDSALAECDGKADGTRCSGSNHICIGGACIPAACGDGVVSTGEDCDDGDTKPGDACPEDCKYQCSADLDCNDGNVCSIDKCDIPKHVCAPKTAVTKGLPCKLSSGEDGICNGTSCASATCGDKIVRAPEECDDGNTNDTDGCKSDCTWTCKVDADCSDGTLCTGLERCDLSTHKCVAGTAVTCNDSSACTRDTCAPLTGSCSFVLLDSDGDGFAARTLGSCGTDCHDRNAQVRPNQANFFRVSYTTPSGSRSFDYNCDGNATQRWPATGGCIKSGSECSYRPGWLDAVPACGVSGTYLTGCDPSGCKPLIGTGIQECR